MGLRYCRVTQDVQGSVPFPYWSCAFCVVEYSVCPSSVCCVCCLSLPYRTVLSSQVFIREAASRKPVVSRPTCTPNNSKKSPFLGAGSQRVKSPSSPSALCQGWPWRGRTESLDFSLLLARPLPPGKSGRAINERCLAHCRREKVWFVILFH